MSCLACACTFLPLFRSVLGEGGEVATCQAHTFAESEDRRAELSPERIASVAFASQIGLVGYHVLACLSIRLLILILLDFEQERAVVVREDTTESGWNALSVSWR